MTSCDTTAKWGSLGASCSGQAPSLKNLGAHSKI